MTQAISYNRLFFLWAPGAVSVRDFSFMRLVIRQQLPLSRRKSVATHAAAASSQGAAGGF